MIDCDFLAASRGYAECSCMLFANILQLTHSQDNVLDLQWLETSDMHPDELEAIARNMAAHLRRLLDQRDTHMEVLM